jgi:hypothetical protein
MEGRERACILTTLTFPMRCASQTSLENLSRLSELPLAH